MEEITLNFETLRTILNEFINDFINTYKSLLIRDGKKSTGNLINSIRFVDINFNNGSLSGEISLAGYWRYVEYGRRPGKFPPPQAILSWIKMKPIIPCPINGLKAPNEKQLSFLIGRKIAKEGIKAGNQFNEALDITWQRWESRISQAISEDLQYTINLI